LCTLCSVRALLIAMTLNPRFPQYTPLSAITYADLGGVVGR
jgi:hypothetical protein